MRVGILDILRPRVDPQLIKRDIIVSKGAFQIPYFFNELISSAFQLVVQLLLLVGVLGLLAQVVSLL